MKVILLSIIVLLALNLTAVSQTVTQDVLYQLDIYADVTEYLDTVFSEFSDGYIEADEALKKVGLLAHEYDKSAKPVPEEAEKLYKLTRQLLSRIENYFIFFKRTDRENPEINLRIAQTKFMLSQEVERIRRLYLM